MSDDTGGTLVEILAASAIAALVTLGAVSATTVAHRAVLSSTATLERAHQVTALALVLDRDSRSATSITVDDRSGTAMVQAADERPTTVYRYLADARTLAVSRDGVTETTVRRLAHPTDHVRPVTFEVTPQHWSIVLVFADATRIRVSGARPRG